MTIQRLQVTIKPRQGAHEFTVEATVNGNRYMEIMDFHEADFELRLTAMLEHARLTIMRLIKHQ